MHNSVPKTEETGADVKKKKNVRQFILVEAKRLFREKGYTGVSMSDLVASIGLTKPTIYYYFADKETLFTEVIVEMIKCGSTLFQTDAKKAEGLRAKVLRLVDGYIRYSPTSLMSTLRDCQLHLCGEHLKTVKATFNSQLVVPIQQLFIEGIEQGELNLKPQQTEELAMLFLSWIDGYTILYRMGDDPVENIPAVAANLTTIFFNGAEKMN